MTFDTTTSATSSPGSEDGATLCDLLGDPITGPAGQALAPASRSAQRASSVAARMSATYGLRSSASSASVALELQLASKLPALLDSLGTTMWQATWKASATPQQRRILAHTASGLRTEGSGCTGWRTPTNGNGDRGGQHPEARAGHNLNLQDKVMLAPWPTAQARDHFPAHSADYVAAKKSQGHGMADLDDVATRARWPTTTKQDATGSARMVGWATPTTRDWKDGATNLENTPVNALLGRQVLGATSNGSLAATAKSGQLNPAFSRWLQGYPKAWCEAAIEAWHQMPTKARKGE